MTTPTTPLARAAARWSLGDRALRWSTTAALVVSILIVLGGGVVRVTGSGLGCPTWPACNTTEVIAPISNDLHQVIEQTNRLITGVLIVAVGWAIIAIRLQRPWNRALGRLSWSMFWLVVVNAVAGGFTVILQLNPWVVALHFVLAMALLATATLTWHRARWSGAVEPGAKAVSGLRRDPGAERRLGVRSSRAVARLLGWAVVAASAVLVVLGTIVSGSGPHSGDSRDVPRMGLDWTTVVWVHGALAVLVVALAVLTALLVRSARHRALVLLVVLLLQGGIGLIQSVTNLPELLVALHVLGSALVWVGAIRVLLDADPALFPLRNLAAELPMPEAAAR